MTYILAFVLSCGIFWFAYEVGKTIGGTQSLQELERLRAANACAQRSLDFVNAELDHVRGLLNGAVAAAHASIAPPRTDPITKWPPPRVWSDIPESMNNEVFYGAGLAELQSEAQEKYTAEVRQRLDSCITASPPVIEGISRIDKYLTADVSWHLPDAARAQMYCFHGISLSDHCGRCAQQNFAAGGIEN